MESSRRGAFQTARFPRHQRRRAVWKAPLLDAAMTDRSFRNARCSAANVQIALREGNLDAGFAEFFFDREIEIALEPARPMAHLTAPDHQLEFDRAFAKLFQENARGRVLQHMRIRRA